MNFRLRRIIEGVLVEVDELAASFDGIDVFCSLEAVLNGILTSYDEPAIVREAVRSLDLGFEWEPINPFFDVVDQVFCLR